jgi:hypothetical protein
MNVSLSLDTTSALPMQNFRIPVLSSSARGREDRQQQQHLPHSSTSLIPPSFRPSSCSLNKTQILVHSSRNPINSSRTSLSSNARSPSFPLHSPHLSRSQTSPSFQLPSQVYPQCQLPPQPQPQSQAHPQPSLRQRLQQQGQETENEEVWLENWEDSKQQQEERDLTR